MSKIRTLALAVITSLVLVILGVGSLSSQAQANDIATPGISATVDQILVSRWVDDFGYDAPAGSWREDQHPRILADVNGDGKADIVGFGANGVYVARSTGTGFSTPQLQVNDFGYTAGGWRLDQNVRTVADVSGDGKADIVGFGYKGVYVALSTGTGFLTPQNWHTHFGYDIAAGGWLIDRHPRLLGDVTGDGRADIVGFGDNGVYLARSVGTGFDPEYLTLENHFGYADAAGAWRVDKHLRMLADVNGDGKADIVGFGDAGVYIALSTGVGFATPILAVNDFGYTTGWRLEQHPRMLADVNGDGKADIVSFGDAGVYIALSTGLGFATPILAVNDFGYVAGGWRVEQHPRMLADVNADGKTDIVGFGNKGVYVALSTGNGFGIPQIRIRDYGYDTGGWRTDRNPRLMGDVNGDAKADVVGFGNAGTYVSTDLLSTPPEPPNGFKLPYPGGTGWLCTQGNNVSDGSHNGNGAYAYAFDFGTPRGSAVVASRTGQVMSVKGDSTRGGCSTAYWNDANFIRVRHLDGTDTLYVHLDSVSVRNGDTVQQGQVIGRSGQTGYTCNGYGGPGPHLHFERQRAGGSSSISTSFLDVSGGVPQGGRWYTSGNYLGLASDTVAPIGEVRFNLSGSTPYTVSLLAEDDTTPLNALEMRLADSESGLASAAWQPFTSKATWDKTTVWVQYRDGAGNISASYMDTLDPVATSAVTAAFTTAPSVCANAELPITNQTTPFAAQYQWNWDFGNGVTSIAPDVAPTTYSAGTYTITLQVMGASNSSTATRQVSVLPAPDAAFTLTRNGNTVTVTSNEANATAWTWDFGDGVTATGRTTTHTYTSIATGDAAPVIHATVQGSNGCSSNEMAAVRTSSSSTYLPLVVR